MKKLIVIGLLLLMCFTVVAPAVADVDISKMSEKELLDLRVKINARLKEISGDSNIIYKNKTATIQWKGVVVNNFGYIQNSMIITNNTKKPLYFKLDKMSYNGFQITASNSGIFGEAIEAGMSYLTTSAMMNLVDKSNLEAVGIKDVSEINDVFFEISFYTSKDWNAEPIKTKKIRISIP